ncbi:MAG TPA: GNAT family N-acetyltransferase [Burkholderiaceae bacterium]
MDATLFQVDALCEARTIELADLPALQAFFDANPAYHEFAYGEPPPANEAQREWQDRPPAGMPYESAQLIQFLGADVSMQAMASVVRGFFAPAVWHLGLFIVATSLHGSGRAQAIYAALERWMREQGAQWLRLGVIIGNARGEPFWLRQGFQELRQRGPADYGRRSHMLRVLMKPLNGGSVADYLALVARDRPDAP